MTFRAWLPGPNGTVAWAAWIEAEDARQATATARALSGAEPAVDLWFATDRRPPATAVLDDV